MYPPFPTLTGWGYNIPLYELKINAVLVMGRFACYSGHDKKYPAKRREGTIPNQ
jgi:hypothetical protein